MFAHEIEILGIGLLSTPRHTRRTGFAGNIFDPPHQSNQVYHAAKRDEFNAVAAITHHDGADNVARRWVKQGISGNLNVTVGMDFYPSGSDDSAGPVDDFYSGSRNVPIELDEPSILCGDISMCPCLDSSVTQGAAPNDVVEHIHLPNVPMGPPSLAW